MAPDYTPHSPHPTNQPINQSTARSMLVLTAILVGKDADGPQRNQTNTCHHPVPPPHPPNPSSSSLHHPLPCPSILVLTTRKPQEDGRGCSRLSWSLERLGWGCGMSGAFWGSLMLSMDMDMDIRCRGRSEDLRLVGLPRWYPPRMGPFLIMIMSRRTREERDDDDDDSDDATTGQFPFVFRSCCDYLVRVLCHSIYDFWPLMTLRELCTPSPRTLYSACFTLVDPPSISGRFDVLA